MKRKPIASPISSTKGARPVASDAGKPKRWTFSFRFFRQIEYFGLDKSDATWCASVLAKLAELSTESIDAFMADAAKKDAYRYHSIKWTQKNIPIKRSDLHWIHREYLDDEDDYPMMQFQISQALGRVVGFWDEQQVFNIVLLDPLHNIQPSKDFNYRVDPCSPLPCKYSSLLHDVDKVRAEECLFPGDCARAIALDGVPNQNHYYDVIILRIDAQLHAQARALMENASVASIEELLSLGVIACQCDSIVATEQQAPLGTVVTEIVSPPTLET